MLWVQAFAIALLLGTGLGCVIRHGDFTVMSNKVVRLSGFELDKADRVKGIVGKDVQHVIIFFPIGGVPTLEGALDDAFEKGGGDVLTDAVVKSWYWYIPYVYGQSGWSVKGDVVKTRGN
ncbi:MAG: hypothetical protein ACE5FG_08645 [Myxococcota bacterium]